MPDQIRIEKDVVSQVISKPLSWLKSTNFYQTLLCGTLAVVGLVSNAPVQAKEITIDRSYSVTTVKVPKQCEFDNFKTTCARLVNLYARRFEREMVLYKNTKYDYENMSLNLDRDKDRAVQKVTMSVYTAKEDDPIFTLFTLLEQTMPGQKTHLLVETINFDAKTGQSIEFKQLFQKPELAAMLCARKIEAHFKGLNSPLLPVVISATELSPSNYIITPFGLRFFFAPGLVDYSSDKADSLLVSLEDLAIAQPVQKWWEGKDQVITADQRETLANSKLSGVISLDDNDKANGRIAQSEVTLPLRDKAPVIKGTAAANVPQAKKY